MNTALLDLAPYPWCCQVLWPSPNFSSSGLAPLQSSRWPHPPATCLDPDSRRNLSWNSDTCWMHILWRIAWALPEERIVWHFLSRGTKHTHGQSRYSILIERQRQQHLQVLLSVCSLDSVHAATKGFKTRNSSSAFCTVLEFSVQLKTKVKTQTFIPSIAYHELCPRHSGTYERGKR